jgi:uncharacterized protein
VGVSAGEQLPPAPLQYLLVKLVSRCNIDCDYCYWFRDASVYKQPKRMSQEIEKILLWRLREHIKTYSIREFSMLLHGGEPLLFGIDRFRELIVNLRIIEEELKCGFDISITTNGTLIDGDWARVFAENRIAVSVSLDGPASLNDAHRVTFLGEGTYDAVVRGVRHLKSAGVDTQLLAVADPQSDPEPVVSDFVDNLGIVKFDIMVPDLTRDDTPISISRYYKRLFDVWFYDYSLRGVDIRYPKEMIRGLLGGLSRVESTGLGPITTVTVMTDGALEPLDVTRIIGEASTNTGLNIKTSAIQDITEAPLWREIYESSLSPHKTCRECHYLGACGGGYLPHRFSRSNRFDNPSVYCPDLLEMFAYVERTIESDYRET